MLTSHSSNKISLPSYCKIIYRSSPFTTGSLLVFLSYRKPSCLPVLPEALLSSCPNGSPLVFLPEVFLSSCPTGSLLVFQSYRKSSCLPVLPEALLSSCPTGSLLFFLSYRKSSCLPVLPEALLSSLTVRCYEHIPTGHHHVYSLSFIYRMWSSFVLVSGWKILLLVSTPVGICFEQRFTVLVNIRIHQHLLLK
jgi:hypothetical protein